MGIVSDLERINVGAFVPRGFVAPVMQVVANTANHGWYRTRVMVLSYPVDDGPFEHENTTNEEQIIRLSYTTTKELSREYVLAARGETVSGDECFVVATIGDSGTYVDVELPNPADYVFTTFVANSGTLGIGVRVPPGATVRLESAAILWKDETP